MQITTRSWKGWAGHGGRLLRKPGSGPSATEGEAGAGLLDKAPRAKFGEVNRSWPGHPPGADSQVSVVEGQTGHIWQETSCNPRKLVMESLVCCDRSLSFIL